jgi:addiction module HigA family antidote
MSKNEMRPIHPGEILMAEYLQPMGLSVNALAQRLRVPATRLHEIVKERRSISADTAMRLARFFGSDAQSWLNLQSAYDLRKSEINNAEEIREEIRPYAVNAAGKHPVTNDELNAMKNKDRK